MFYFFFPECLLCDKDDDDYDKYVEYPREKMMMIMIKMWASQGEDGSRQ